MLEIDIIDMTFLETSFLITASAIDFWVEENQRIVAKTLSEIDLKNKLYYSCKVRLLLSRVYHQRQVFDSMSPTPLPILS